MVNLLAMYENLVTILFSVSFLKVLIYMPLALIIYLLVIYIEVCLQNPQYMTCFEYQNGQVVSEF